MSWPEAEGAARYVVARQLSGSSSWTSLDTGVTTAFYEDTTAVAGKRYRYRVRAYNAAGASGEAANSEFVTALAVKPGDILSVTATATAGKISVSWPEAEGAARYVVARQASGSSWSILNSNLTDASYEDLTAAAGTKYRYRVRAYNAAGASGAAANSEYVTALAAKPADIASVTAVSADGVVTVTWSAAEGAEYYKVARQESGSSSWKILSSKVTDTAFEDYTATPGTQYRYRVRGYNGSSSGGAADSAYVTAAASSSGHVSGPPADIASVAVTASPGKITVTWPEAENASYYRIARRVSGGSYIVLDSVVGTSFEDYSVEDGKKYSYRVRAYNGDLSGGAASSAFVTATGLPPAKITSVTATASPGKITVTWPEAENARYYVVARKPRGGSLSVVESQLFGNTYEDFDVVPGTEYIYRVRGYNGSLSGGAANSVYVMAQAA